MSSTQRARLVGRVVGNAAAKTIVVSIESERRHRVYKKAVRTRRKLMAHDPGDICEIGDTVEIESTRPLSRHKRWRIVNVVQRPSLTVEEEQAVFAAVEEDDEGDSEPDQT
jgi:small subunit ribosomal protein S17